MRFFKIAQDESQIEDVVSYRRQWGRKELPDVMVLKNPSMKDISWILDEQEYGEDVGIILTEQNIYAFRRDLDLHKNVAGKLGLSEYVGVNYDPRGYAMVSDATTNRYREKPEAGDLVRRMLPNVREIRYFNDSIVGSWDEIDVEAISRPRFFKIANDPVRAAAYAAGYDVGPVFHGSASENVTVFDPSMTGTVQTSDWGRGIYFTPSSGGADSYRIAAVKTLDDEDERLWQEWEQKAKEFGTDIMDVGIAHRHGQITDEQYEQLKEIEMRWRRNREELDETKKGRVYPAYLMVRNPEIYRYVGITDPYLADMAKANGKDSVIVTAEDADTSGPIRQWAQEILVFEPNQIKSAAPTTYDDQGNPIPLEQRFDPSNPDIRY